MEHKYSTQEIEDVINSSTAKLPAIKLIAKQLNIKVSQKKQTLIDNILNEISSPKYIFERELENIKISMSDIHKDNIRVLVVEESLYDVIKPGYSHKFVFCDNQHSDTYYNEYQSIKETDLPIIKSLTEKYGYTYRERSDRSKDVVEHLRNASLVKQVIGIGKVCVKGNPCIHSLKFLGIDDQIIRARYVDYKIIREALLNQMTEDELDDHFKQE